MAPALCREAGHSGAEPPRRAPVAYAVLKTGVLNGRLHGPGTGCVLLSPLCSRTLQVLMKVARAARGYGAQWHRCIALVCKSLTCGRFVGGDGCWCDLCSTRRCLRCSDLRRGERDPRWCSAGVFRHSSRAQSIFPWWNGRTDAVGEIECRCEAPRLWLSCPSQTHFDAPCSFLRQLGKERHGDDDRSRLFVLADVSGRVERGVW
jgi:hypothetical protein